MENPPSNVWLGFSAEHQRTFDERWEVVKDLPYAVRFLSYEPALGPIDLPQSVSGSLHWVIYGGETSTRREVARIADLDWARDIRRQCSSHGIAYWFKQTGSWIDGHWYGKSSKIHREKHALLDGELVRELPHIPLNNHSTH